MLEGNGIPQRRGGPSKTVDIDLVSWGMRSRVRTVRTPPNIGITYTLLRSSALFLQGTHARGQIDLFTEPKKRE